MNLNVLTLVQLQNHEVKSGWDKKLNLLYDTLS